MQEISSSSSSSFPANYVTLKDLQERWIKRKQDEENEERLRRIKEEEEIKRKQDEETAEKLRRLQEEEEIKSHNKKESKNHRPKSKNPHSQKREPKEKNLAKKPIDAKSEPSKATAGRRRAEKLRSGRSRMPPSRSESAVEIGHKREKKKEKGVADAREDRVAEVCRRVEDISVAAAGDRRGGRICRGGGFGGRRGGGAARVSSSGAGMVWVRKTTEG